MKATQDSIPLFTEADSFPLNHYKDFSLSSYQDKGPAYLNRMAPHKHTYYEIIFISSGRGNHVIDFLSYPFEGPCLFLLHPGNVHQLRKEVPTNGYVLKFSESFFALDNIGEDLMLKFGVFDNIQAMPVLQLQPSQASLLEDLLQKMLQEYKTSGSFSRLILFSFLKVVLLHIWKFKDKEEKQAENQINQRYQQFRMFKQLIETNFAAAHGVQYYADLLHSTPKSLNTLSRQFSGKTAGQLIQARITLEAKRLLFHGRLTIKEIATRIGFEDPAYFSRFFTKQEGYPPSAFKDKEALRA